tara:strand:+ start:620 stop:1006 length:387 start_codon:yes stop_codon:yes gene_type:complete
MPSIFLKIIAGEIPCHKVAENDNFLAFLDINPLAKGHTLVVPKREVNYIFELEDEHYQSFWLFAKRVAKKIESAIDCERIGVAVIGLEVPHAHIHLVPIQEVEDIDFSKPKLNYSQAQLSEIASLIRS